MGLLSFRIACIPYNINPKMLIDSMLGAPFSLYHEFSTGNVFLLTEDKGLAKRLETCITGLKLEFAPGKDFRLRDPRYIVGFNANAKDSKGVPISPLHDIHELLNGFESGMFIVFTPANAGYVSEVKERIEEILSRKDTRISRNFGDRILSSISGSIQNELYYGLDDKKAYIQMLDTLNESMLLNGFSYKASFLIENGGCRELSEYLKMKLMILGEEKLRSDDLDSIYAEVKVLDSLPMSNSEAALMITFPAAMRQTKIIKTPRRDAEGDILLGYYLEGSTLETKHPVSTFMPTLNLGTLITGLPGSGKTFAAMSILGQILEKGDAKMVIMTPTEEWSDFGSSHGMEVIRLYGNGPRINFFSCMESGNTGRFYENLAMLIAHASNTGPYKSPLEKCLLSAFHKVYAQTRNPDPSLVYAEIEEAIIERHARRTNTGVKYTKHGENIRASLENLRLMLLKAQFAYADGMDFDMLLRKGCVFDLSGVSNSMKPFFYALVLNQIYSFSDSLDLEGDDKLRMLLCIEEAQIIFDNFEQSTATLDLRQRLQDFRKKGMGLMLITHNVTDINIRIRRLCQTKLYFRQSSDIVKYAANDLLFDESDMEALADRLKSLEHRTCILNYLTYNRGMKNPAGSLFIKVPTYTQRKMERQQEDVEPGPSPTNIKILNEEGSPLSGRRVEARYVGEKIWQGQTDIEGRISLSGLLCGKAYELTISGEKRRDTKTFIITGGADSVIKF